MKQAWAKIKKYIWVLYYGFFKGAELRWLAISPILGLSLDHLMLLLQWLLIPLFRTSNTLNSEAPIYKLQKDPLMGAEGLSDRC